MKKLLFTLALVLFMGTGFAQSLQKGNLLGIYRFTVTLEAGVSFEMYLNFLKNKHLPELEKYFPDTKGFVLRADRGAHKNEYALLWLFKSAEQRDSYIDTGGNWTESGQSAIDNMSTWGGLRSLGKWSQVATDWIIQ